MGDKNTNFFKDWQFVRGKDPKIQRFPKLFTRWHTVFLMIWLTIRYWLSHIDCLPLGCFPGRMWSFKDSISHGWITHSTWIILLSNSSFTQGLPASNLFVRLMKRETIFECVTIQGSKVLSRISSGILSRKRQLSSPCLWVAELIKNIRSHYLVEETKPQIVNQQYVVYSFKCNLCNAGLCGLYARTITRTCRKTQTTVILNTQTL